MWIQESILVGVKVLISWHNVLAVIKKFNSANDKVNVNDLTLFFINCRCYLLPRGGLHTSGKCERSDFLRRTDGLKELKGFRGRSAIVFV